MSQRAHGDIFRDADSVSYQTAKDQLSMSYTFHYMKEELEMNEGVGRARIDGERWRCEPRAWMMSWQNETVSSLAIILYFAAYYLNGCVPNSVCGKWSCSGKATHWELPVMSVFIGSLMDKRGSKKTHRSVISTLFKPQKGAKLLSCLIRFFPDMFCR